MSLYSMHSVLLLLVRQVRVYSATLRSDSKESLRQIVLCRKETSRS